MRLAIDANLELCRSLWICFDSTLPFLRRSRRSATSVAASFQSLNAFGVRSLELPNSSPGGDFR